MTMKLIRVVGMIVVEMVMTSFGVVDDGGHGMV